MDGAMFSDVLSLRIMLWDLVGACQIAKRYEHATPNPVSSNHCILPIRLLTGYYDRLQNGTILDHDTVNSMTWKVKGQNKTIDLSVMYPYGISEFKGTHKICKSPPKARIHEVNGLNHSVTTKIAKLCHQCSQEANWNSITMETP